MISGYMLVAGDAQTPQTIGPPAQTMAAVACRASAHVSDHQGCIPGSGVPFTTNCGERGKRRAQARAEPFRQSYDGFTFSEAPREIALGRGHGLTLTP